MGRGPGPSRQRRPAGPCALQEGWLWSQLAWSLSSGAEGQGSAKVPARYLIVTGNWLRKSQVSKPLVINKANSILVKHGRIPSHPNSSAGAQPCHNPQNHSECPRGWGGAGDDTPRVHCWVYLHFHKEVICKSAVNPTVLYDLNVAGNHRWHTAD